MSNTTKIVSNKGTLNNSTPEGPQHVSRSPF
uniref:Uncharacterized protein n=1 Tax=Myoviridae sp. ctnhb8 TaxID=2825171 RepID=A0A8S5VE55_9CAUD|nr:MAG TPA: hypothetical protein [Myoviridae sp. ctnhb8]